MTDHLAHLQNSQYQAAQRAWLEHVYGTDESLGCQQCQAAPGPPPRDCPPEQRELYACDEGTRLHEVEVRLAQIAYEEIRRGRG